MKFIDNRIQSAQPTSVCTTSLARYGYHFSNAYVPSFELDNPCVADIYIMFDAPSCLGLSICSCVLGCPIYGLQYTAESHTDLPQPR